MARLNIIIILFLLSFQAVFSQTKEIKGDTAFWNKRDVKFEKKLDLKNFEQSTDEFNFRFRNRGQVIEISKNDSVYSGNITNFIYHNKRANRNNTDTLSNKITLSSKQAEEIYKIVKKSKIIDLPTDEKIENWKHGFDGIVYIIEHSDKKEYWLKSYWTPRAQDSIPEAIIVLDLINNLSETLDLEDVYSSFKNTLPRKGCYDSGGTTYMCYATNSFELGYSGATKLPLGFYLCYSATYVGKAKVDSGIALQYNFDNNGFHHLNIQYAKWNMFYKTTNITDFVVYNYQNRLLNFDGSKNKFENHQIGYGLYLKNHVGLGMGFDFISRQYNKLGAHLYAYKSFSKPNVSVTLRTSIFDNQINYKAELFKSFFFNYKFPIRRVSLGLAYEDFMDYKDLYFSIRMLF
ncbi:hypothetical protein [Flavobacterium beibuense]|uniref:hypothetical protein n=1 Tax=Flavobacterium beibuense TaxID=657326 RepID=UPI003A95B44B